MKKKYSFLWIFHSFLSLVLFTTMAYGQNEEDNPATTFSISNIENASNGECNGSISLDINPYPTDVLFEWSTGEATNDPFLGNLCPGTYTVIIYMSSSSSGCQYELTATVNGEGACYIEYENWNFEQVFRESCSPPQNILQGVDESNSLYVGTVRINPSTTATYQYTWSNGATGAEVEINTPGDYFVEVANPLFGDCKTTVSVAIDSLPCDTVATANKLYTAAFPPVIINEFSNGKNAFDEYIELLVIGNYLNCEPVDLRNFIIDDNNGAFSPDNTSGTTGRGVSPGHLRFPNTENWRNIPVGALIVIFNEKYKNTNIAYEDPTDYNNDGVYILSAVDMVAEDGSPTLYDESYDTNGGEKVGYWSNIMMFDHNDAIQVRYPDGTYCHGISYGGHKVNGGPANMKISTRNGKGNVYYFEGISPVDAINYATKKATDKFETPGVANNQANQFYITSLCNTSLPTWQSGLSNNIKALVHPNPFVNNLHLNVEAKQAYNATILLVDFSGKILISQTENIAKGMNKFQLDLDKNQIASGLYNIRIVSDNEVLFSQKVVCIK